MREVVIVSAARTPIANFGGALASLSASELGAIVIAEVLKRAGVGPSDVDEVYLGNILQAGQGQGPARQAAIKAGLPKEVPATTINKLCGSGLKSVTLAAQAIKCGDAEVVVAGGTESMSQAPYLLEKARTGYRMGNGELIDSMVKDGLTDVFNNYHMGVTAENLAEKYGISREEQDEFSATSQQRAEKAITEGRFSYEIVPVPVPQKKGEPVLVKQDEFPRFGTTREKLAALRPAFKKDGTVTAGNASGVNDGAAAVLVMSAEKAKTLGIKPLATILSYASAGVDPGIMGIGPVPASRKALQKADLKLDAMDLIEANEAFAAQACAVTRDLGLDPAKVNPNGSGISLGHPIGATGALITVKAIHELQRIQGRYALVTMCIGGGQGIAAIFERI